MFGLSINGEPIIGDKTIVTFRILERKIEIIDQMAKNQDLSRSQVINLCIDNALANPEFVEQFDYKIERNDFDE